MAISGCIVPGTFSYYHPESPGGTVIRASEPPTNSVLLFHIQEVIIGVNTQPVSDGVKLSISFEVPSGSTARLNEHHVELVLDSKESVAELSGSIWVGPGRTGLFRTESIMNGEDKGAKFGEGRGFANTKYAAFFFHALLFNEPWPDVFNLRLPTFTVNGVETNLPLVRFTLVQEKLWVSVP